MNVYGAMFDQRGASGAEGGRRAQVSDRRDFNANFSGTDTYNISTASSFRQFPKTDSPNYFSVNQFALLLRCIQMKPCHLITSVKTTSPSRFGVYESNHDMRNALCFSAMLLPGPTFVWIQCFHCNKVPALGNTCRFKRLFPKRTPKTCASSCSRNSISRKAVSKTRFRDRPVSGSPSLACWERFSLLSSRGSFFGPS